MPYANVALQQFNRGIISDLGLARTDVERTAFMAEEMENWIPRVLGSMIFRPGLRYINECYTTVGSDDTRMLPFIFSSNDIALLELSDGKFGVWVSDSPISRVSVSAAVTNGDFGANITGWTGLDEAGATSGWRTGYNARGLMRLTGTGVNFAIREQQVTLGGGDSGKVHHLVINVGQDEDQGQRQMPVTLLVGSSSGDDDYVAETTLYAGQHNIAFTPTTDFWIRFKNKAKSEAFINDVNVGAAGDIILDAPWAKANDLWKVRFVQSGNVVFLAHEDYPPYTITRRGAGSWSIEKYYFDRGPVLTQNTGTITLTPTVISGSTTVTASKPLFVKAHEGGIWKTIHEGQYESVSASAENTFTDPIRVVGVGDQRIFTISRTDTWVATVTLQRSLESDVGPWEDMQTWTTNDEGPYDDGLDNQIAYYRLGIKTGDYTSGTAVLSLSYSLGETIAYFRIRRRVNSTVAEIELIDGYDFGSTDATPYWNESAWSAQRGWPSSVGFAEGRLSWAGNNKFYGSVSDDYYNFDDETEGDSGPLQRSIGFGPVDNVNWILPLRRLIMGTDGGEFVCKSTVFDEPLTPTNFTIRESSNQGSAAVVPIKIDNFGVFAQRGGTRLMQLNFESSNEESDTNDLTILAPEVCQPRIKTIVYQRQPDTRIHAVLTDGTVAMLVYDRGEDVKCWLKITTDGEIEDAVVLPGGDGEDEDRVYYVVKRVINSVTYRYLEKWAKESECVGGSLNKQADAFISINQASSTTITGLSHLEGESVVVWANSKDLGTYTVASGQITVSEAVTTAIVGLTYNGDWKSAKLAYAAAHGTALTQKKRVTHLGVILKNTHHLGLKYGPSFTDLDNLPQVVKGKAVAADTVHAHLDEEPFMFNGRWDTDSRLCLRATAPRPANVLAGVFGVETHEKM